MRDTSISFGWRGAKSGGRFCTGVCLHGHTMHSEECLSFLPRYLRRIPGISPIIDGYERGRAVDFGRAYWTPPLSPVSASRLEEEQIAGLGLEPLVSLTDHDDIQASMSLRISAQDCEIPISVEWTVPYEGSILHLGVHNLPAARASGWMNAMSGYTHSPSEELLPGLLNDLAGIPEVLIVLNHPFWLEEGVTQDNHRRALDRVLRECVPWLHAFELNGTRGWAENARVSELAREHGRPAISGGDRHACEPAACINLTNARTFAEFVSEIRAGHSSVHFQPHYREPMTVRVLEAARDILRTYPEYPGRERWTDRFFYRGEDGVTRTLSALWRNRVPWGLAAVTGALHVAAAGGLRPALRMLLAQAGEMP